MKEISFCHTTFLYFCPMKGSKKIIVAVTGASGAIYARQLAAALQRSPQVEQIAMIASNNGKAVARYEKEVLPAMEGNPGSGSGTEGKIVWFDNGVCPACLGVGTLRCDGRGALLCRERWPHSLGCVARFDWPCGRCYAQRAAQAHTCGQGDAAEYHTSAQSYDNIGVRRHNTARQPLVLFAAGRYRAALRHCNRQGSRPVGHRERQLPLGEIIVA